MAIKDDNRSTYYNFLDKLRASAVTNMFGAAPYLQEAFPHLSIKEAREILSDWMAQFGKADEGDKDE